MKESIRKWREGEMEKGELNRRKRQHERMIKEKRQKEKERYKEEVEKAVKEGREWEVINRERGGRKGINEEIGMKEWTKHFKGLLGGVEYRVKGEGRKAMDGDDDRENEISREEVNEAITRLKRN
ncbi:cyclic nucleotide-gated channel beta-1-like [Polyergus mexicanus]|uniref:cyclic nucleotide-gated channel beta-1-like n=1 Tax=Polyergus mexicanus TaxID=615972 RepID=UPI0038B6A873